MRYSSVVDIEAELAGGLGVRGDLRDAPGRFSFQPVKVGERARGSACFSR